MISSLLLRERDFSKLNEQQKDILCRLALFKLIDRMGGEFKIDFDDFRNLQKKGSLGGITVKWGPGPDSDSRYFELTTVDRFNANYRSDKNWIECRKEKLKGIVSSEHYDEEIARLSKRMEEVEHQKRTRMEWTNLLHDTLELEDLKEFHDLHY